MAKKKADDQPLMERVRALFEDSGLSLVELGRLMGYAEETARQSAWQFMKTSDPRLSMVRKFAAALGIPLGSLTTKGVRMTRKLETELTEVGCAMDAAMFRELVAERHAAMHPVWTEDELTCHPDEAKAFCGAIRNEVDAQVPDHIILRTLLNVRKAG